MPAPLVAAPVPARRRRGGLRRGPSVIGLAVVCAALVLGGCGDDSGSGGSSDGADGGALEGLPVVADSEYEDLTGESEVVIAARDNNFVPQYVTISPGTKVTFINEGRNPYNVIAVEDGAFPDIPTEDLQPAAEADITFEDAGDFPYYCSLHGTPSAGMTGRLRVVE